MPLRHILAIAVAILIFAGLVVWSALQPDTRSPQQIHDACVTWGPGDDMTCSSHSGVTPGAYLATPQS